ncbi:T9SS type A sorting domain-containing protein [Psychroserpens luteolus]|uniref:T9SS type A sorting domain-containing protein n=1 Tax=Psychroserpens luteolus TaxID=2855840 RepID=UPI001E50020B|nr:T9SS type A sorting domain-containing protein [Psychroserpens luteolus]MCD2258433.1 T9SS type A sorting domain-containing protein [Psychroserpens luteolus]
MKKTTLSTVLLTVCLSLMMVNTSIAQELLYEVPLNTQVQSSSDIIEGKVISKTSFWDDNQKNIFTVNTVEVYKIFKGQTITQIIEVITPGGTVGSESEVVTPSLSLEVGDIGVFMLHNNDIAITNGTAQNKFKPFASSQGFYKYNLKENTVHNPFQAKEGITDIFYNQIRSLTNNTAIVEVSDFNVDTILENNTANRNVNGATSITSFSPTTLNGGVKDQLTITGAGFGATEGTVEFRDANAGGEDNMGTPVYFAALSTQIISWSNTEIVVEVPSRAGTGDIRVTTNGGGSSDVSSQTLTVFYSQINPSNGTNAFSSQHFDTNGNGGYTWQMFTDFDADADAKASFLRAFDTWVCTTGVNWEIGAVTTTDEVAADGINIIRFDNGTELPEGVLGRCTSRFGTCGGFDAVVTELDIVFNDVFTGSLSVLSWEFGPDTATGFEVDFESVAVHELGHGHQLAHIIDAGEVMHYSIANGQNSRDLGASDLAGGTDVMDRNVAIPVCSQTLMTYSACSTLGVDDNELAENISIYPNPVKHNLNIRNAPSIELEHATIYDVRGRRVLSKSLSTSNTLSTINVSELQSGVYFIKLKVDNTTISKKFIVE